MKKRPIIVRVVGQDGRVVPPGAVVRLTPEAFAAVYLRKPNGGAK